MQAKKFKYFLVQGKWRRRRVGKVKRAYLRQISEEVTAWVQGRNRKSRNEGASTHHLRTKPEILIARFRTALINDDVMAKANKGPLLPDKTYEYMEVATGFHIGYPNGVVSVPARYPSYMPKKAA